jgi:hypothetical protein
VTHANFDLLFSKVDDKTYHVRVIGSSAGSASAQFTNPFSDLELENLKLRLGQSRRSMRRIHAPQLAPARAFGERLFDTVFAEGVRDRYHASFGQVTAERGLRIRLRLTDVPEIACWPWEFLYDSTRANFLALSKRTPVVRYLDLPEAVKPLEASPPLRILLMVSSPTDYDPLDVEQEVGNVRQSLAEVIAKGFVVVERVDVAALSRLQRMLSEGTYHIFHFIGHGALSSETSEGVLMFEDERERGRPVAASTLGVLLRDHPSLRVAVLNACEGARTFEDDAFSGTAQKLVQQGVPAVVAMQSPISDDAAIRFSHEFYAALGYGHPVDCALAEARKAIYSEIDELEWATPVLYMRADDAGIFATPPRVEPLIAPDTRAGQAEPATIATEAPEDTESGRQAPGGHLREVLGLTRTTGTPLVIWGTATFALLLTALCVTAFAVYQRWFNLLVPENATAVMPFIAAVVSVGGYLFAALISLLTHRTRRNPAQFARWTSLTAAGTPSIARFAAYALAVIAAVGWWVSLPPTLGIVARDMPFPDAGSRIVEDLEELVYREVRWHIGAGSSSEDVKVQVQLRSSDRNGSVFFGRAQIVEATSDGERARNLPPPRAGQPLSISWSGATSPGGLARLQFTIAREATVEKSPSHVEIDVEIVRNGKRVARKCDRVVEQWTRVRLDAEPDGCSALQ